MSIRVALLAALIAWPGTALAEEDGWGDDGDDIGFAETADIKVKAPARPYSLTGFLRSREGIWLERLSDDPLSTARQSLDLKFKYKADRWRLVADVHGEYDLAYTLAEDDYDVATLDAYQWRLIQGEQYLAFSLGDLEFVLGRQAIAWGEGDVFSPLDVISPRDEREPGLADLDDLRLATLATRISYFSPVGRFELVATHEGYFGERASALGEFSPFGSVFASDPLIATLLSSRDVRFADAQDRYDPESGSVFLRWLWNGEGLDLGLYGAWLRDRQGTVAPPEGFEMLASVLGAGLTAEQLDPLVPKALDIELDHRRYWLVGHSGSAPMGDWLIKWELAAEINKPVNTGDLSGAVPVIGVDETTVFTGLIGLTYSGISETTLAVEMTKGLLLDEPQDLFFPLGAPAAALRISRTFLRETLRVDAAATALGWTAQYGWLARVETQYAVMDGLKLGAALVHYGAGDDDEFGPFTGLDSHDQLLAKLRWDFTIF